MLVLKEKFGGVDEADEPLVGSEALTEDISVTVDVLALTEEFILSVDVDEEEVVT